MFHSALSQLFASGVFGVNVHVSLLDAYSTHMSDQKFVGNFGRKNQMQRRYLEDLHVFTPRRGEGEGWNGS